MGFKTQNTMTCLRFNKILTSNKYFKIVRLNMKLLADFLRI